MTTTLIKTLPLAVALLVAASGCEFVNFEAPVDPNATGGDTMDAAGPVGPPPLYPFRPGSIWQYDVTALDGTKSRKYVAIDKAPVMVGGNGEHQLEMAYGVRTSSTPGGQAYLVTMQQQVGDQIVKWREQQLDGYNQVTVDTSWDPQQLEIDQSTARTQVGASWQEDYTEQIRPAGSPVSTVKQSLMWKVVREEMLTLPGIEKPFSTIVYQTTLGAGGTGGTIDAGVSDAGKVGDAGTGRPMLRSSVEAEDGGAAMPKTMWWARGYGKVKEAGGGEPTEELSALELH